MTKAANATTARNHAAQSTPSTPTYRVQLAVYDLSKGTAMNLSRQFLGPDYEIRAVPHTAVLAYGKEYYFGSGVGVAVIENIESFRRKMHMEPFEVLDLGTTNVPQSQFEDWCRKQADPTTGTFRPSDYHLFEHNCNTFSQFALTEGLKMINGGHHLVPQWILDVPGLFLASPLGRILAQSILENMQLSEGGIPLTASGGSCRGSDDSRSSEESLVEFLDGHDEEQQDCPSPEATDTDVDVKIDDKNISSLSSTTNGKKLTVNTHDDKKRRRTAENNDASPGTSNFEATGGQESGSEEQGVATAANAGKRAKMIHQISIE